MYIHIYICIVNLETTWPDRARSPGRGICSARSEMRPGPPRFVSDLAIFVVLSTWRMPFPFHIRSFRNQIYGRVFII